MNLKWIWIVLLSTLSQTASAASYMGWNFPDDLNRNPDLKIFLKHLTDGNLTIATVSRAEIGKLQHRFHEIKNSLNETPVQFFQRTTQGKETDEIRALKKALTGSNATVGQTESQCSDSQEQALSPISSGLIQNCTSISSSTQRNLPAPSLAESVPNSFTEMLVSPADYPGVSDIDSGTLLPQEIVSKLLKSRYGIISAGINTANGETEDSVDVKARHKRLKAAIEAGQYAPNGRKRYDFVQSVEGRYSGSVEKAIFIHFAPAKTIGDLEDERKWLMKMGSDFGQDSIIYSIHGLQFLAFTTDETQGSTKPVKKLGTLHAGVGIEVFPNPPKDNYTRFKTSMGPYYFSLNFNFDKKLNSWKQWQHDFQKENASRYPGFTLHTKKHPHEPPNTQVPTEAEKPILFATRGVERYREWTEDALKVPEAKLHLNGINKDALIVQIEQELANGTDPNYNLFNFPNEYTRNEAERRMRSLVNDLMTGSKKPNIIVGAMNKTVPDLVPWAKLANDHGYKVVSVKTGELKNRYDYLTYLNSHISTFEKWNDRKIEVKVGPSAASQASTSTVEIQQVSEGDFDDFPALLKAVRSPTQEKQENLAIQLFPTEYRDANGTILTGPDAASKGLAKGFLSKLIPPNLRNKQYSWSGWNGGPHLTIGFVKNVNKSLIKEFVAFFNKELAEDIKDFKFVTEGVAYFDAKKMNTEYTPLTDDGKLRENHHLILTPDAATIQKAKALNAKCVELTARFKREHLGEHAPEDSITVDATSNGPNYNPHISVWSAFGDRADQLRDGAKKAKWKFSRRFLESQTKVDGRSLVLDGLVIE